MERAPSNRPIAPHFRITGRSGFGPQVRRRLTMRSLGADSVERLMFRRLDRLVRDVQLVTVSYEDSSAAVEALAELVA